MELSYPCRILKGDRISIPKEIMKLTNLKEGDFLIAKLSKKHLLLKPCKVVEVDIDVK